jgi:hypothetical protein
MFAARRKLQCSLGWLLLLTAGPSGAAEFYVVPSPRLSVPVLEVQFVTPTQVRLSGEAVCTELPLGQSGQYGQVEVGLHQADSLAEFPILIDVADSVAPNHLPGERRVWVMWRNQQRVPAGPNVCMGGGWTRGWRVFEHLLRYPGDEGQPVRFDVTQDLGRVKPSRYYQVVVCLHHSCDSTRWLGTAHTYSWVVYGPFAWGKAPRFAGPLTTSVGHPASFPGPSTPAGGAVTTTGVPAGGITPVTRRPGHPRVVVDGQPVTGPRAPAFIKGTLMAPMMAFVQAANLQMGYARDARRVMIMHGPMLQMWVGKSVAKLGDRQVPLATPPVVVSGEVYLPLRFTVEALGGALKWDAATQTATVTIPRG